MGQCNARVRTCCPCRKGGRCDDQGSFVEILPTFDERAVNKLLPTFQQTGQICTRAPGTRLTAESQVAVVAHYLDTTFVRHRVDAGKVDLTVLTSCIRSHTTSLR